MFIYEEDGLCSIVKEWITEYSFLSKHLSGRTLDVCEHLWKEQPFSLTNTVWLTPQGLAIQSTLIETPAMKECIEATLYVRAVNLQGVVLVTVIKELSQEFHYFLCRTWSRITFLFNTAADTFFTQWVILLWWILSPEEVSSFLRKFSEICHHRLQEATFSMTHGKRQATFNIGKEFERYSYKKPG